MELDNLVCVAECESYDVSVVLFTVQTLIEQLSDALEDNPCRIGKLKFFSSLHQTDVDGVAMKIVACVRNQ